jgi:DNA-directed RNA polymerase subunit alpha
MKFKSVMIPKHVTAEEESRTPSYGKFVVEPLERGFGTTLGNSLRRVLLSSIQGAAVTGVRIEGVLQEVSSIPGVVEDVTDIILNLKQMILKVQSSRPVTLRLEAGGEGKVTAAQIEPHANVEILNPDLHIATLADDGQLKMDIIVDIGRGYVPADLYRRDDRDIHYVPVDAVYSPIRRVKFEVENARVEEITDYDRLILEIWTNGTIEPEEALAYSARILRDHLMMFVRFPEEALPIQEKAMEPVHQVNPNLFKGVDELELSVRSYNCLKSANIRTIADLVQKSEAEMLKFRNFGKKSLSEIKELLDKMNLSLGMTLDETELREINERREGMAKKTK